MIRINKDVVIEDREIKERFVRSFGPGGQNVRREATAVELSMDIGSSSLPPDVKDRLIALAGRGVTAGGVLVVVSRAHRSQLRNRDAARSRFLALLRRAAKPPKTRTPTKPDASARETRLASKRLRSAVKESRAKGVRDVTA
jgi:ribosome-associated protein